MSRDTQPVATLAKVNRRLERVAPGLELVREVHIVGRPGGAHG